MNKKEQYDVIIVGNGIASKIFLFFYFQKFPESSVGVIESPLYPSCSIKTTSHVAMVKKVEGSGKLGNLVVESFQAFESFVQSYGPKGVELGKQFVDSFENGTPHYFITPNIFFNWLNDQFKENKIEYFSDHISSINESEGPVTLEGKDIYYSKRVLLASGPGFHQIEINGVEKNFYKGFVKRPGSYWIVDAENYQSNEAWVYTKKKANLIYRKEEHKFLLGGTTNANDELGIDFSTLIEWHREYQNELSFLPDFKNGNVDSGIRFRGPKRMPFSGSIPGTRQIYALTGLHKNGFSYPFLLAKKCLDEFVDDKNGG